MKGVVGALESRKVIVVVGMPQRNEGSIFFMVPPGYRTPEKKSGSKKVGINNTLPGFNLLKFRQDLFYCSTRSRPDKDQVISDNNHLLNGLPFSNGLGMVELDGSIP